MGKVVTVKTVRTSSNVSNHHTPYNRSLADDRVFVSRHTALQQYCREIGLISQEVPCFKKVQIKDIKDKDVIGALPLELASYTRSYTEIPLKCRVIKGEELSIEDIRMGALSPRKYKVERLD